MSQRLDRLARSEADRHRYTPGEWTPMRLFDVLYRDSRPTLLLVTDDGTERRAQVALDDDEALRLLKSVSAYLLLAREQGSRT
jgi:hypothetical protein